MMSSGTTPHLIAKESQTRMIGYGGMLFESFVAIMALVAAISLNPGIYYSMNTPQASIQKLAASSYQADKSAEYNAAKAIPNVAMMPDGSKLSIDWEGTTGEKALERGRARLDAVFRAQAAPHSGDADAAKRRGCQGRAGGAGP